VRKLFNLGWEKVAGATLIVAGLLLLLPMHPEDWYTLGEALLISLLFSTGVFLHQTPEYAQSHRRFREEFCKDWSEEEWIAHEEHRKQSRTGEWLYSTIGGALLLVLIKYATLHIHLWQLPFTRSFR
jgi:hypothetical protein